ncbi:hypothetical protein QOZ89_37635, partial [Pseudofrankia sp. BMG5.37]
AAGAYPGGSRPFPFVGRTTGDLFPLVMIKRHSVTDGQTRKIDVYCKNPDDLATFHQRCEAAAGA